MRTKKSRDSAIKPILDGFTPARGLCFVRRIETEEAYAGSKIVIPQQARDKVSRDQFVIIEAGDWERCEDYEECEQYHMWDYKEDEYIWLHPHDLVAGDWVLIRYRSLLASPDPGVHIVSYRDVLAKFLEAV